MIITDRLIWLHIPKTAGDATLRMFKHLDLSYQALHERDGANKHATLAEARAVAPWVAGLPVLANLRRLPEVALSYFHHMQRHSSSEKFANGRSFGEMVFADYCTYLVEHPKSHGYDWILNHYLGPQCEIRWLNVARLADSFIEVVGGYHPIAPPVVDAIRRSRDNVGDYNKNVYLQYTFPMMQALYDNAPRWTEAERREYGTLLTEELWG